MRALMEDYRGRCTSAFLNDQNFAITIGKPGMADGRTVGTVHVSDLAGAGSALAPRAGIAVGREDPLSRVHRLAVWLVSMRVKSTSSQSSTGVKLTHGTTPGSAEGGTWLQPSSRSARAMDPSNALMCIERLS